MGRLLPILLLSLLLPCLSEAQENDCHYKFSGSDKSDFEKGVVAYNNKRYQQCITLMRKVSNKHRTAADPYFYLGCFNKRTSKLYSWMG